MFGELESFDFKKNNDGSLRVTIIFSDGGRKEQPQVGQKYCETSVKEVHDLFKGFSAYKSTHLFLEAIDYYDEGHDHYSVPGASISKGERKPHDNSWDKTSIPKAWECNLVLYFGPLSKPKQILTKICESFKLNGVTPDTVAKLLKKSTNPSFEKADDSSDRYPKYKLCA